MDDSAFSMSPFIFNAIQSSYLQNLSLAFTQISHYAVQLFYLLAVLEICLFGLIWALKQQEMFALLLFKIIKLGFIFYLISNYPTLLNALVNGLAKIGLGNGNENVATLVFSPDLLWRFGFDSSISLLTLAVQYGTANIGMSAIYLILGFGILLMFALIACEIIILIVGFYLLALMALLFLPFGSFVLTENLFRRSIHGVIKGAVRIFALIVIVGIGLGVWIGMNPTAFGQSTTLDQPLGLFIATLVITLLCWKIPNMLAESVGEFGGELFNKTSGNEVNQASAPVVSVSSNTISQVAAASNMASAGAAAGAGASGRGGATLSGVSTTAAASSVHVSTTGSAAGLSGLNQNVSELTKAVKVQKEGISRDTLNKLKATFKEALQDKKK